jgi:hypothetical protein
MKRSASGVRQIFSMQAASAGHAKYVIDWVDTEQKKALAGGGRRGGELQKPWSSRYHVYTTRDNTAFI